VDAPPAAKYLDRDLDPLGREFYRRLESGELATTRCVRCERTTFPPLVRCAVCGGATEWVAIPRSGRLYAFTTQETGLRFTAPVVLALVELGEVTLPAVTHTPYGELVIGQEVTVEPFAQPDVGITLLSF
jgi:uncharacterized OB-fold protein